MHPDPSSKVYASQLLSPFEDEPEAEAEGSHAGGHRDHDVGVGSRVHAAPAAGAADGVASKSTAGKAGSLLSLRRGVVGSAPRMIGVAGVSLAAPGAADLPLSQTAGRPPSMRLAPTAPAAAVHGSSGPYSSPARLRGAGVASSTDRGRPAHAAAVGGSHARRHDDSPQVRAVSFDDADELESGSAPASGNISHEPALSGSAEPLLLLPGVEAGLLSADDRGATASRVGHKRKAGEMEGGPGGSEGGGSGNIPASAISVVDSPESAPATAVSAAPSSGSAKRHGVSNNGAGAATATVGSVSGAGIAAFFKPAGAVAGGGTVAAASATAKKPRTG